jgi:hypothetical protein
MLMKATHVLLVLSALALLAYPAAMALDSAYGQDVYLLASVNSDDDVETNRELFDLTFDATVDDDAAKREQVLAIYGNVAKLETERVLVFDDARVTRPAEDPQIAWLPAGSAGGDYPIQSETVAYTSQRVTLAGAIAAVLLLVLRWFAGRRGAANEAATT